jgi:cleavage and polyadenylation specificity factor subunit 3
MMRLKSKLLSLNAAKTTKVKVYSPRNCEELRIPFKADKTAKVVGKLASIPPPLPIDPSADANGSSITTAGITGGPLVTGVLVQNDFKLSLMAPEDLREYAGLNTTTITCKQRLTLSAAGIDLIKWALEGTFGTIEELPEMRRAAEEDAAREAAKVNGDGDGDGGEEDVEEAADEEVSRLVAAYLVMGCVTVRYRTSGDLELEWEGNMFNDGIADSVMAVLFSVESSPAAVKRSSSKNPHTHGPPEGAVNPHALPSPAERLERLLWFLEAQFGADNVAPVETPRLLPGPAAEDAAPDASDGDAMAIDDDDRRTKEIERLHKIGIPVPGVSINVDKMSATVWLENLDVECNNKVFADRVRAVVERAVEVTAPLWA